jgi:hypothetical protein
MTALNRHPERVDSRRALCFCALLCALASGCGGEEDEATHWQLVHGSLPGALMSIWGTSSTDVWAVGADAGDGAQVFHFDGERWSRLDSGHDGDLWWVFGFEAGPVYMGGTGGVILRYEDGAFTRMRTGGTGVVFGIWGSADDDMWAVGGAEGGAQGAFAWRKAGDEWSLAPGFLDELAMTDALWKVFGRTASDVWMVGTNGKTLHYDGSGLSESFIGVAESLFTVHASSSTFAAVGGFGTGVLIERAGGATEWENVSPSDAPSIIGVCLSETSGYAVGEFGYVARREASGWRTLTTGLEVELGVRSLHSVWIDELGNAWTVGGQIRVPPLVDGVILHSGAPIASEGLP